MRSSEHPGTWPDDASGRIRVLVESEDGAVRWACENVLARAGFEVATCGGPDELGACALVETRACPLEAGADVVVCNLSLSDPANRDVVRALCGHRDARTVIVEAPDADVVRHRHVVWPCSIAQHPMTGKGLVADVRRVLGVDDV
jgi:hypothetical protein